MLEKICLIICAVCSIGALFMFCYYISEMFKIMDDVRNLNKSKDVIDNEEKHI